MGLGALRHVSLKKARELATGWRSVLHTRYHHSLTPDTGELRYYTFLHFFSFSKVTFVILKANNN